MSIIFIYLKLIIKILKYISNGRYIIIKSYKVTK